MALFVGLTRLQYISLVLSLPAPLLSECGHWTDVTRYDTSRSVFRTVLGSCTGGDAPYSAVIIYISNIFNELELDLLLYVQTKYLQNGIIEIITTLTTYNTVFKRYLYPRLHKNNTLE